MLALVAMQMTCLPMSSAQQPALIRPAGKNNRSRAFALMIEYFAFNLGSIFATVAEVAPTSSELLEQGRKLLGA